MTDKSSFLLGYWQVIGDADSASSAAKMSGLPILLFGLSMMIYIATQIFAADGVIDSASLVVNSGFTALGVLLCVCALRIRAGHHVWLPFVLIPMLVIMATNIVMGFAVHASSNSGSGVTTWMARAIGLLLVLMVVNGLRGWSWKRRNNVIMTF